MSEEEEVLSCPTCHDVLMTKCGSFDSDVVVDHCRVCHGLWFDAGELRQTLKSEGLKGRFLGVASPSPEVSIPASATRDCPRCARPLHGLELAGVSADVCVECSGVWLDAGELLALINAERGGELEEDESSVAYELREGLASGSLTPGLLRQLLDALKDWLNREA